MKHGKAVGPDNLPIEVFAVLEDIGIDFLTKLLNSIYDSGKIPKDLAKSVFITLPKIPGTMDCELVPGRYHDFGIDSIPSMIPKSIDSIPSTRHAALIVLYANMF